MSNQSQWDKKPKETTIKKAKINPLNSPVKDKENQKAEDDFKKGTILL